MTVFPIPPQLYPTPGRSAPDAPHVIKGLNVQALDTRHVSDGDGRNTHLSISFNAPTASEPQRLDKRV